VIKLQEILNSVKKPDIEISYEMLSMYKDCDIYIKKDIDLNKLHRIWHTGVVGNRRLGKYLFVMEACGSRVFVIKNNSDDNEMYCRFTKSTSYLNKLLNDTFESDTHILEIIDRIKETGLQYVPIDNNNWTVKVLDTELGNKKIDTVVLDSEFLYEAFEEFQGFLDEHFDFDKYEYHTENITLI